jgi:hypothetical protein
MANVNPDHVPYVDDDGWLIEPLSARKPLPDGIHKELPRRGEDDPMRRFLVDCRTCDGAGAGCPSCGDKGTQIIEIDADEWDKLEEQEPAP